MIQGTIRSLCQTHKLALLTASYCEQVDPPLSNDASTTTSSTAQDSNSFVGFRQHSVSTQRFLSRQAGAAGSSRGSRRIVRARRPHARCQTGASVTAGATAAATTTVSRAAATASAARAATASATPPVWPAARDSAYFRELELLFGATPAATAVTSSTASSCGVSASSARDSSSAAALGTPADAAATAVQSSGSTAAAAGVSARSASTAPVLSATRGTAAATTGSSSFAPAATAIQLGGQQAGEQQRAQMSADIEALIAAGRSVFGTGATSVGAAPAAAGTRADTSSSGVRAGTERSRFTGFNFGASTAAAATPAATTATTAGAAGAAAPTWGFGTQFRPAAGSWRCDACFVTNSVDRTRCEACETPNPTAPAAAATAATTAAATARAAAAAAAAAAAPAAAVQHHGNDSDSDSDIIEHLEAQERAEELARVRAAFTRLNASGRGITASQIPALFEALGTTYSEAGFTSTLAELSDAEGIVTLQRVSDWYMNWLFADDGISSDGDNAATAHTWTSGTQFRPAAGSWRCDSCYVRNAADRAQCAACEVPNPTAPPAAAAAAAAAGTTTASATRAAAAAAQRRGNDSDFDSDIEQTEAQHRGEELARVHTAFSRLSPHGPGITATQFPALFEALGTPYFEGGFASTLAALSDADGFVSLPRFSSWYIRWLYSDDYSSDEDSDTDAAAASFRAASYTGGFGSHFQPAASRWRCGTCSVRNSADRARCAACETPNPAAPARAAAAAPAAAAPAPAARSGTSSSSNVFTFRATPVQSASSSSSSRASGTTGVNIAFQFGSAATSGAGSAVATALAAARARTIARAAAAAPAAAAAAAGSASNTLQACVICSDSFTADSFFTVPACGHQVTTQPSRYFPLLLYTLQ
jgi:trimeric autotransporter adhesin